MKKLIVRSTRHNGATHVREFRFIRLVQDVAALRPFYENIFDWPVVDEWDKGVTYDTGSAVFELIQEPHAGKPNESSRVSIYIPDVWSLFEQLKDKVTLVFPLRDNSWGDTSFRIQDPEGFPITFFTPSKKKTQRKIFNSYIINL